MKTIDAKCKFCGIPLKLEIDDDYHGDHLKLVPLAACNRCADLREERRRLQDTLRRICLNAVGMRERKITDTNAQRVVKAICEKYAKLVARWYGYEGMAWDDEFPAMIIDNPGKWSTVLAGYWVHFQKTHRPK